MRTSIFESENQILIFNQFIKIMSILDPRYQPTRAEPDLNIFMARTADELIYCFIGISPHKTPQDYQRDVFSKVLIGDDPLIEDASEIFMQFLPESDRGKHFVEVTLAPLLNATAYYCRALSAYDNNQKSAAWSYLVDANYWCGISSSYRGIGAARNKTIADTAVQVKTQQSSKAGTGKGIKSLPYKLEAEQLARTMKSRWPSRRQAVIRVLEKLNEDYAKRNQAFPLKYDAIFIHFGSLPDADQLFEKYVSNESS